MQIHELPVGSPASGVQFAGDTGTQTQKIDYDALADAILNKLTTKTFDIKSESQTIIAALNALGDASKQGVANNLVTTAAGLVLDARQGKALKDLHDSNANGIASLNSSLTVTEEYLPFTYENKTVNIYFRKYGKMITVLMAKDSESMALPTSWTSVGNLTNIKPPSDRYIPFVSSNGYTGVIRIYPDGGVRILGNSSNLMWLQCSATTIL